MNSPNRTTLIHNIVESIGALSRLSIAHSVWPKDLPTRAQLGIMLVLVHRQALSIKDLAVQFGISSSAATQLVNGMVESGLLARTENTKDRRYVHIDLTAKGKKQLALAQSMRMKKMAKMLDPLSNEELAQFFTLQQKMFNHMTHYVSTNS